MCIFRCKEKKENSPCYYEQKGIADSNRAFICLIDFINGFQIKINIFGEKFNKSFTCGNYENFPYIFLNNLEELAKEAKKKLSSEEINKEISELEEQLELKKKLLEKVEK